MARVTSADNPQWQKQMQAGMAEYEQKLKKQLDRAKQKNDQRLAKAKKRNDDLLQPGQERSDALLQQQQEDHQYFEQKKREYSPEVTGDGKAQARELYRQKFENAQTLVSPVAIPSSAASSSEGGRDRETSSAASPAADEQSRFGMAGMRGALAKQRRQDQVAVEGANKSKLALAGGQISTEAANEAIKKASQLIWTAVHEFLEDAALSFVDIMIITGPLCVAVFVLRIAAMCSLGSILTLTFKGVQVPLVPLFSKGEILQRCFKTLLILVVSGIVWFIIGALIWAIFDPAGMTWTVIKSIFGGGGGGAGAGATGTY
jgi:hypothetical protein